MLPFSLDTDYANVSQQEANSIAEIWKTVSEDYAPFDIDVTTERPASFGPNVGHVLISPQKDSNGVNIYSCSCGGVAWVNVWGDASFYPTYQPALVFPEALGWNPKSIAEAASHELGHNLSLGHDGRSSPAEGYYQGQGTGNTSWAPIMGVGYSKNVTQWSKGEYAFANNTQDDIALIAARLTFSLDDHANSTTGATLLVSSNGVVSSTSVPADPSNSSKNNKGVIETSSDVDYFYFDATISGTVNLAVNPDWIDSFTTNSLRSANLDARAVLYDSLGNIVAQSDVLGDTYAQINTSVVAGRYFLGIEGVGAGNASTDGYSDYGSLGRYFISGTIPNATSTVSIGAATYSFSEGGGTITIPVTRSSTAGTATVNYATANGTAIAGSDYTAKSGTLSFAAGVASANITVAITNDTTAETSETFSVALSAPSTGMTLGSPSSTTVTITDNEAATVGVGAATYNVSEAGPNIVIPVTRLGTLSAATVAYASANGTATAGSDYTAVSGTLNFAAGVSSQNVTVPITNDTTVESNETFALNLSAASGMALRTPSSSTVTIVDNDSTVRIGAATYSVSEGTASITIPVTRTGTAGTATVNYATANGTATAGSDYTAKSGTMSFAAGVATVNIVVSITNDTTAETSETFSVSLSSPSGVALGSPTTTTVTITDNEAATVGFGAATYSVSETGPNIVIPVRRLGTLSAATVAYATASGTATTGTDFTTTSGTLSFASGVASLNITVPITNDTAVESNETFAVNLSSPSGMTLRSPSSTTVTIVDNDVASTVSIGSASYSVSEGAGSLTIPVTRSSSTSAATVNYATANGTATAGSDYTTTSGTLSFAVGVSTVNIIVPITNDVTAESNETFTVGLSAPSGMTLGSPSSTTVTIADDDSVPVTALQNGVPVAGISGAAASAKYYSITIPAGAANLTIAVSGGTGDADLYVKFGGLPTTLNYDCRPYAPGNNESCISQVPSAGTYYIMVYGFDIYSSVTLTASYTTSALSNGVAVTNLSGAAASNRYFSVAVPVGATNLQISTSGGTPDVDLYVKYGSLPTLSSYDCRPFVTGNSESCGATSPVSGIHYVMLNGYTSYSGVTLLATYTAPIASLSTAGDSVGRMSNLSIAPGITPRQ